MARQISDVQRTIDRLRRRLTAAQAELRAAKASAGKPVRRNGGATHDARRHAGLAGREAHSAIYRPEARS